MSTTATPVLPSQPTLYHAGTLTYTRNGVLRFAAKPGRVAT